MANLAMFVAASLAAMARHHSSRTLAPRSRANARANAWTEAALVASSTTIARSDAHDDARRIVRLLPEPSQDLRGSGSRVERAHRVDVEAARDAVGEQDQRVARRERVLGDPHLAESTADDARHRAAAERRARPRDDLDVTDDRVRERASARSEPEDRGASTARRACRGGASSHTRTSAPTSRSGRAPMVSTARRAASAASGPWCRKAGVGERDRDDARALEDADLIAALELARHGAAREADARGGHKNFCTVTVVPRPALVSTSNSSMMRLQPRRPLPRPVRER